LTTDALPGLISGKVLSITGKLSDSYKFVVDHKYRMGNGNSRNEAQQAACTGGLPEAVVTGYQQQ